MAGSELVPRTCPDTEALVGPAISRSARYTPGRVVTINLSADVDAHAGAYARVFWL